MECSKEQFHIMYFIILVLCECGEELNNSIVPWCVYAMFHEQFPLLEHEHDIRARLVKSHCKRNNRLDLKKC